MDYFGIVRRVIGAAGAALVAFGVASAEDAASLTGNVEAIIGGVMFLIDFVPSIIKKLRGATAA